MDITTLLNKPSSNGDGVSKNGESQTQVKLDETADVVKMQQLGIMGEDRGVFAESGTSLYDICPECGAGSLAYEEGCRKCYSCGYAEC